MAPHTHCALLTVSCIHHSFLNACVCVSGVCRTKQTSMEVFSLHPGSIVTNLGRHLGMLQNLGFLLKPFLKNAQQVWHRQQHC